MTPSKLLELWAQTRAPEVSALAERLSPRPRKPIYPRSASSEVRQRRWLLAAASVSEETLQALLDTLHDGFSQDVAERLAVVATWPDDPRIASALTAMWENPAHLNVSTQFLWRLLGEALVARADQRSVTRLRALQAQGAQWSALFKPHMRPVIPGLLAQTLTRLEPAAAERTGRPLTDPERRALAHSQPPPTLDDALAAVWAQPDDLSRRQVYADALTALDDPRGEFITLQCLPKRSQTQVRRANTLLRTFGRDWAGPLKSVCDVVTWERGFPAVVQVNGKSSIRLGRVVGHPAWSTVHTIALRGFPGVVVHPSMQHVRRLVLYPSELRSLCRHQGEFPVRSLVFPSADGIDVFGLLAKTARFPRLVEVVVQRNPAPAERTAAVRTLLAARPGVTVRFTRNVLAHPSLLDG